MTARPVVKTVLIALGLSTFALPACLDWRDPKPGAQIFSLPPGQGFSPAPSRPDEVGIA